MMNKRGLSHVGFILAFVMFVGFVVFILIFLNPTKTMKVSKNVLEIIENGIEREAAIEVKEITLNVKNVKKDCFRIDMGEVIENVIAKKAKSRVEAENEGGMVEIKGGEGFYYLYFSDEFSQDRLECNFLKDEDYSLGKLNIEKIISYEKLLEIKQSYDSDYENLKRKLGIPASNDFGFLVYDEESNVLIDALKQPDKTEIIAKNIPTKIIYTKNAEKRFIILNVRAW